MTNSQVSKVVVTGLGATTPVGGTVAETWSALLAGQSGVKRLTYDWIDALPVQIGAPVAVEPEDVLDRRETKRNDRSGQFALVAAREAWADAGRPEVDPERLGVVIASGIGGVTTLLSAYDTLKERGARRVPPLTVPMLMPNGPAAAVGLDLGARAGVHTTVSACASGAEGIGYAADMIRTGRADVVVAGGVEAAIHALPIAGFAAMQALSTRMDEPERASRPYDKGRDGFVLGEGGGIVILESEEHALARGARIYAEVLATGITSDGHHIAAPDPSGTQAARAMRLAIEQSGLTVDDIVHINAHATSTPVGDVAEAVAIRLAIGDAAERVCVSATKSMTGHLLGGAGAVEGIATILALYHRVAPPTINLDDPDDDIRVDIPDKAREMPVPAALNDSFGFGGHNVALLFRKA
jgi:3-oxoacyl-[acyl-carrier-protein] synthase II